MASTRKIPEWFSTNVSEEISDSTVFKFNFIINGKPFEVDMRADLGIDYTAIRQHLEDSPAEFAYWSSIYSEMKYQTGLLERKVKARRGTIIAETFNKPTPVQLDGGEAKRYTDKQTMALMEIDPELDRLERLLLLQQKHTGKMWAMMEAIRIKSDNLRTLAGFAKLEQSNYQNQQ